MPRTGASVTRRRVRSSTRRYRPTHTARPSSQRWQIAGSTRPRSAKGFAVVYDQLAADNYTGLGICLESQTTSAALAYYGVPAMAVTIAKGREWIVERAAGETGHAPAQVAGVLEEFVLDPDAAAGDIENALAGAYDALVAELIDAVRAEADETDVQQGLSVPIAIGGDGAIEGVEFLVGGRFDAAALPFSVRGVRLADGPAESAVRVHSPPLETTSRPTMRSPGPNPPQTATGLAASRTPPT